MIVVWASAMAYFVRIGVDLRRKGVRGRDDRCEIRDS
jgi:hypothetical protein